MLMTGCCGAYSGTYVPEILMRPPFRLMPLSYSRSNRLEPSKCKPIRFTLPCANHSKHHKMLITCRDSFYSWEAEPFELSGTVHTRC
jgi:hypothetical protein